MAAQISPSKRPTRNKWTPWLWGVTALSVLLGGALALSLSAPATGLPAGTQIEGVAVGGLEPGEAQSRLDRELPAPSPVTVRAGDKVWTVSAEELGWERDLQGTLDQAQGYAAGQEWTQRITGLLGDAPELKLSAPVKVNKTVAAARLAELVRPLEFAPQDGKISFDAEAYTYKVEGGRAGKRADVAAAAAQLAAQPDLTELNIEFRSVESKASPGRLQEQVKLGNALIRPMTVQLQGSETAVALTKQQVANLYWVTPEGIKPDPETMQSTFDALLAKVDRPAHPARFVSTEGGKWLPQEGRSGYEVQQEAAWEAFQQDVLNPEKTTSVWPSRATEPTYTVAELPDPATLELVATGESVYDGSSEARRENIQIAADKIDGYVVPPGEDFSFLDAVGGISEEGGFVSGLIIAGGQTVDGLGGGVCQVSTTAFRSLYNAGLPIVERHQHSYRVPYYEPQTGFEAAVYDPGLDLKMTNDTGAPLVVRAINDNAGSTLKVELWGKKPARTVNVSEAVITGSAPIPAPKIVATGRLAPGVSEQVEAGRPGLFMYITRTITDASGTQTERLETNYEAWQPIIERGVAGVPQDRSE